jgi:hypothetical protein
VSEIQPVDTPLQTVITYKEASRYALESSGLLKPGGPLYGVAAVTAAALLVGFVSFLAGQSVAQSWPYDLVAALITGLAWWFIWVQKSRADILQTRLSGSHGAILSLQRQVDELTASSEWLSVPQIRIDDSQLVVRDQPMTMHGVESRPICGVWTATIKNRGADTNLYKWTAFLLIDGEEHPCDQLAVQCNLSSTSNNVLSIARGDIRPVVLYFTFNAFSLERIRGREVKFRFQVMDTRDVVHPSTTESGIWMDINGKPIDRKLTQYGESKKRKRDKITP